MTVEGRSFVPRKGAEKRLDMPSGHPTPPRPDRVPPSPPNPDDQIVVISGRFRKARVKPIKRYGAYRGAGSLRLEAGGLGVMGKHVRPLGTRVAIGMGLFLASVILSAGRLAIGLIPIYLLVEYVLLQEGMRTIPWSRVARYSANERKKLIAIETNEAETHIHPLVLKSDEWREALQALRRYCPASEFTPSG